jgi:hypothetical protein
MYTGFWNDGPGNKSEPVMVEKIIIYTGALAGRINELLAACSRHYNNREGKIKTASSQVCININGEGYSLLHLYFISEYI